MTRRFFQGIAMTAFCASFLLAQGPGTPPTPADMVAHQVERLTTLLTLTAAQQAQATTIFTAEVTAASTVQTSLKTAHTALNAAVLKNDTATINAQATQIGTLTTQLTAAHANAQAAFYLILTPDQQTKYATVLSRGNGRGFGGPGPGRFGGGRQ
jgi:Spy/CpxP family protein refolding chaperone